MKLFLTFLVLLISSATNAQSIKINEVMSSNYRFIKDEDGDSPDWLEIYNSSSLPINLNGYSLTDEKNDLRKWFFPEIEIMSNEYLLLFASGKDRVPSGFQKKTKQVKLSIEFNIHTNFSINSEGEVLILVNQSGEIVDSIFTGSIPTDVSRGRFPNGTDEWFFFENPTPGLPNEDNGFNTFAEDPEFSLPAGYYNSTATLSLSTPTPGNKIYYTTDGSIPDESSALFTAPLILNSTAIIRARAFQNNFLPSTTITKTYIFNPDFSLPVISLVSENSNFFDYETGIYVKGPNAQSQFPYFGANFWEDWERPIHIEFFETDGVLGFNLDGGVKIFGQWSRAFPQKSLSLFARGIHGYSDISYQLFPQNQIRSFQSIVLRNSGNDWDYSLIRDALMQAIVDPLDIDKQSYRPAVVYLNGNYWGIHNIREKISTDYIASHYDLNKEDINLLENDAWIIAGNNDSYLQFLSDVQSLNMTSTTAYEFIDSKIDLENFIDYQAAQIFFDNRDWPGNNVKFWQRQSTNSKWRWILFDTDFGFGIFEPDAYKFNTLEFATDPFGPFWPNPPWSTFLLRKFLQNEDFKNKFISRYSVYLNTIFSAENINDIISEITTNISEEMPEHTNKWNRSYSNWLNQIIILRNFANNRSSYCLAHIYQYFNLTGQVEVNLRTDGTNGFIEIENFQIFEDEWSGFFYKDIPLNLKAKAISGFRFSHWEGDIYDENPNLILSNDEDINLTAVFVPYITDASIVINEINYNSISSFNVEDWIELYNNSENDVNISDWIFKDENENHSFSVPSNTVLPSHGYVALCQDTSKFKNFFPDVNNVIGNFDFGLSNGGELLRLYDSNNNLIDSLTYDDISPWPTEPDGNGPTLSLFNPTRDNSNPVNWTFSSEHGTPGKINDVFTSSDDVSEKIIAEYKLFQNYPNPFNPVTVIEYQVPQNSNVTLDLYSISGELVAKLINKNHKSGSYFYYLNAQKYNLTSGVYIYRMVARNESHVSFVTTKKLMIIK